MTGRGQKGRKGTSLGRAAGSLPGSREAVMAVRGAGYGWESKD